MSGFHVLGYLEYCNGEHLVTCCGVSLLVGSSDKVRLTDVSTITLHSDKLTTGRRSSPVPQV